MVLSFIFVCLKFHFCLFGRHLLQNCWTDLAKIVHRVRGMSRTQTLRLAPMLVAIVLTLCLPCAALSWGQPTWQGLGFSGLVHEETRPCASTFIQSIFETVRGQAGCINSVLVQSPNCSICQWLDLRKNSS